MQRAFVRRGLRMRGFTLIEIMVVIVILGVLAALVVPRVLDRPDESTGRRCEKRHCVDRSGAQAVPSRQSALSDPRTRD